mgnify:CR=1 FL=1
MFQKADGLANPPQIIEILMRKHEIVNLEFENGFTHFWHLGLIFIVKSNEICKHAFLQTFLFANLRNAEFNKMPKENNQNRPR